MTEDRNPERWQDLASDTDEAIAVRDMAEILVSEWGRVFISGLERGDAEYYIGILDRVSCDPHLSR